MWRVARRHSARARCSTDCRRAPRPGARPSPVPGRHDDALERQLETRRRLAVAWPAGRAAACACRCRSDRAGVKLPAAVGARRAFGHHLVVDVAAHHRAGRRLSGDRDMAAARHSRASTARGRPISARRPRTAAARASAHRRRRRDHHERLLARRPVGAARGRLLAGTTATTT